MGTSWCVPKRLICTALAVGLLSFSALAADTYKTTTRVNFRTGPSTSDSIIKLLDTGATIEIEEYNGAGWSKGSVDGKTGYIKSEYIKKVEAAAKQVETEQTNKYKTTTRVNFRKGPSTSNEVIKLLNAGTTVEMLEYDAANWSKVTYDGQTGYIKSEYIIKAEDAVSGVELVEWSTVKEIFKTYTPTKIVDARTGAVYYIQCFSKGSHADVETLTKEDTEILYKTFGRRWQWSVRPVWVTIGDRVIAGSINGMPHGSGTISGNGMDGQVCIHFKGSKPHNGNTSWGKQHQNGVTEAYNLGK